MVRFKVIKGSHLLLGAAVLILLGVLIYIWADSSAGMQNSQFSNAEPAQSELSEAKAQAAFASDAVVPLQIDIVPDIPSPSADEESAVSILIYHTHTHEAYAQDSSDPYEAVETWRTEDAEHSVVRLGALLADELRRRGYQVIHDASDHEQDSLNDSYVRSLHTLQGYSQEFDLCIDLHRDAYSEGLKPYLEAADGLQYAQLMLLVGRGDNYADDDKPDYDKNLQFAQALTGALNAQIEGICRNVTVKQGRYNQHIGKRAILVEVGHNENTLKHAMASIPCLAEGIHKTLIQLH